MFSINLSNYYIHIAIGSKGIVIVYRNGYCNLSMGDWYLLKYDNYKQEMSNSRIIRFYSWYKEVKVSEEYYV
jgi:hypothetical protein